MTGSETPRDPLNLDAVDQAIRLNSLEDQLQALGMDSMNISDDCPPAEHEQFLKGVLDYESAPISCQFDVLIKSGVKLPSPATLSNTDLHAKLWEVIHALAKRDVYLFHTDHLSDRELYEHLWSDSLREQNPIMPPGSGWMNHIDMLGGCSEEDIQLCLRYYDDEPTRQRWAKDFPADIIPPHEDPPYKRDHLLPKPPEPPFAEWDDESDDDPDDEDRE